MGYEVDTPFIAAILTILGYSINDTIVIYDRIRENLKRRHNKNWTLEDCMDESVNQTAIRSLNTSITTLFSVIALLIFGGASLKTFYNDIVNRYTCRYIQFNIYCNSNSLHIE